VGSRGGLPTVLTRRLPEIYRTDPSGAVTPWFLAAFLLTGGVSPAVSGEESGWVLRVEGDGSELPDWWERAGSGALSDALRRATEYWEDRRPYGCTA
jgi:hypothetical protein